MKGISFRTVERDKEIRTVLEAALSSMEENFVALVDRPVSLKVKSNGIITKDDLLKGIDGRYPCMIGTVSKSYEGMITLLVNLADAITLSCLLRMVAEEAVKERREKGEYDDEDKESFGEVGNILFSAVDEVFRNKLPKSVSFRLANASEVSEGSETDGIIPDGELYAMLLEIKIGDFPEGECVWVMAKDLAEAMNGAPFDGEAGEERGEEEELPNTVDGILAVFHANDSTSRVAKDAAGRLGLKLEIRTRGEIPNPATLKGKYVVLEVPDEEEKYFQWCKRLKKADAGIHVIMALGWPTKRNVLKAFKAGADQILGLPCKPEDMAKRIARIAKALAAREEEEREPQESKSG